MNEEYYEEEFVEDPELFEDELDEWDDEEPDDELAERLALLEQQLGVTNFPTPAEVARTEYAIEALEEETGIELSDEDYNTIGTIANEELGGDVVSAFGLVAEGIVANEDSWDEDFRAGVAEIEKEIGRGLVPSEVEKLYEAHEDVSDPNPVGKFKELWPDGKGDFDIDSRKGGADYIDARLAGEDDGQEPVTNPGIDSTSADRADYIDKRFNGAEIEDGPSEVGTEPDLDTSAGRADAMDAALADS